MSGCHICVYVVMFRFFPLWLKVHIGNMNLFTPPFPRGWYITGSMSLFWLYSPDPSRTFIWLSSELEHMSFPVMTLIDYPFLCALCSSTQSWHAKTWNMCFMLSQRVLLCQSMCKQASGCGSGRGGMTKGNRLRHNMAVPRCRGQAFDDLGTARWPNKYSVSFQGG